MGLLATALACLAVGPGCGGSAVEAPSTAAQFAISYERSGGLAAMPQKLVIKPGRHAAVTTREPSADKPKTVRFRVSPKQVTGLRNALERADFQAIGTPGPSPGVCADCFFYEIEYRGHDVSLSQVDVPERLAEVIERLEGLIAAHRPRH